MKNETSRSKILVIGANGGIGKQAVELALKNGHYVTAILRNPGNITLTHPNLEIVQGDIMKPDSLKRHVENKDAVISAIGSTSFKETTLYSQGNKNLLNVLEKTGTSRVFVISASGLEVNPSHSALVRFATKNILQKLLKNMYADLWRMEEIVKASSLNWTIMRPPRLTNAPLTGKYRFSFDGFLKNGLSIARADVAHFMISNITNEAIYKKTVEVAY